MDVALPENHKDITEPMFETLSGHFREFMEFGGFPQVVLKATPDEKRQTLQDIFGISANPISYDKPAKTYCTCFEISYRFDIPQG